MSFDLDIYHLPVGLGVIPRDFHLTGSHLCENVGQGIQHAFLGVGGSEVDLGGRWNRTVWVRRLLGHARKGGGPVDSSLVSVEVASP